MTNHAERFHAALTVLAGQGNIKNRLRKAYEDNLAEIEDDNLPVSLKPCFADLRSQMNSVAPMNGEGPICASVRKMSEQEASECAAAIVDMFSRILTKARKSKKQAPEEMAERRRVPPFLVKTN